MTALRKPPAPPGPPDLSRIALLVATAILFACLETMIALAFWGSGDGLAASLFDTCGTVMISTAAGVLALLGLRSRA